MAGRDPASAVTDEEEADNLEDPLAALAYVEEVTEETGLEGELVGKLGDVKYFYVRKGGQRIFKVVSFFLVRYRGGRIGEIPAEHAHEVEEARWLPLDEAPKLLAYKGEREMAENARMTLQEEVV